MNARTTTLLTVLALTLAACVAPIQAPPIKAPQPQTEQALPFQSEPAQNKLPVTQPSLDPWAYPDYAEKAFQQHQQKIQDIEAARLLAAQQALTDKLMVGLPEEVRPFIETYAAIEVAKAPVETALPATTYMLPEQKATNPKQPAIQELDNMLKPVTLPEDLMAAKIAMLEHNATIAPPEVQAAIQGYIEELKMPASAMPARDQWYLEEKAPTIAPAKEPYWENFFNQMETVESLPASTMPVRDQWYIEQPTYMLPEQMTTSPKQPDIQALDNMLKPLTLPEDLLAAKIAMLEHNATTAPPEVQAAIQSYIADLNYAVKAQALYQQHQREKAAYALLNDLMTFSQPPVDTTKEQAAYTLLRDLMADQPQELVYEAIFR